MPVWIKLHRLSTFIICVARFYKDAGWFFPFHNLKAENITFCYYFSWFSEVQFLCWSQAFLSTDQNEQCRSVSCSTSHNPNRSSTAWQKSSLHLVWYLLVPCGCLRHPGHIKWDCTGTFRNRIIPKQGKHIALLPFLSQSTLRQVVHARN